MIPKLNLWSILAVVQLMAVVSGFYLPGVAPTDYKKGESIPLLVNHLTPSMHHMSQDSKTYVYSYDYYYPKFHFCPPANGPQKQSESLGSIIFGDRIFNSPFEIKMLEDKQCQRLCRSTYSKEDSLFVNRNIRAGYSHNWIIDGLPAAHLVQESRTKTNYYGLGFSIGEVDQSSFAHFYNHFSIQLEYHKRDEHTYRVVGFTVSPSSLDRRNVDGASDADTYCSLDLPPITLKKGEETQLDFTYDVKFVASDKAWATRWDKYLHVYDPKIQWFSLVNFSLIVVVLGIAMANILLRTLKNDIMKYNEVNLDNEISDESGWKLVHGDVFRPPRYKLIFSVLVGSGIQIFLMTLVTIVFALFGVLSPSNRGSLSTFMFILYIFFSAVSSFVSSYLYRFFGGEEWKMNILLNPLLVPGSLFSLFVLLNFFLVFVNSSGAIPIGTMLAIVVIWFVISIPLAVVGSLLSYKRPMVTIPVKTNQIPRQIPPQPWYLKQIPIMLISGIFPFGSIAVEMYFIYTSIWFNRIFYMFGFLFFCFVLMIMTTSLISVLMIYYLLCSENYQWHWKSMFIGGGCAVYVLLHSLFLVTGQNLGNFTSIVLYFGYSLVISLLVFLCCGAVGFVSCFVFIRRIYSQIKID
ncbi:hypothetical protein CANTEDRAFT_102321 [Yamadazyma tenuis ATCC 10573]|uniref:Transmembrane 9 superfamily member n=1 Tax=Candida tenuis (strain ATCC 10573 / BCRC 21748 / CBS 615 / JCM 9827 / NBRC 10315 / NRRL Y-1498 / VKM Y-70) TaxID=590646 RepID=G3AXN1_CANTC|nr:uncharacterized protein CANTEDRAFT_102321 [Yamadazyma tenuis ATCC 10573]EGV65656.1 hypothetical protein CANTEDRAFT_102321 [Yamadazyma tenuis ATCC 10573]